MSLMQFLNNYTLVSFSGFCLIVTIFYHLLYLVAQNCYLSIIYELALLQRDIYSFQLKSATVIVSFSGHKCSL